MSHRDDGEAAVIIDGHDNGVPEATATYEDDNEDRSDREPFFQCLDRVEPSGPARADEDDPDIFPSDDGEEDGLGDDVRVSFATAVGDELQEDQALLDEDELEDDEEVSRYDYDMWMEADDPVPIKERRRRLLQGMGLNSSKDLLRSRIARTIRHNFAPDIPRGASRRPAQLLSTAPSAPPVKRQYGLFMKRCRSDNRLAARGGASRKPPPPLRRVSSVPHALQGSPVHMALRPSPSAASKDERGGGETRLGNGDDIGHSLRVKNLDGDNEMLVSGGQSTDGAVDNAGTGEQLSVGEFERFVGCPPLVTQLMRRSQSQPVPANKDGGKKKPRWLKNIKLVATAAGLLHEKDRNRDRPSALPSAVTMAKSRSAPASASASAEAADSGAATPSAGSSSSSSSTTERLKVHHSGKSSKDLTGLYMRQEVRAHEGSIWSIKFSADGRFLATGGEDRVVRVSQVVDADAPSSSPELCAALFLPPLAPTEGGSLAAAPGLAAQLSKKVRRKSSKHVLPDHVVVPDTLFALAEEPACEFEGHVDDVLDLSWSRQSPRLLSSSMDKTVRLWDVESKTCLKVFTHSDYVTCIQFNPADDGYFISGSLDCKVRIWSVADRQVVDWSDLTDMVTAACYTPDGQAAIVGSHKGCCRFYKTRDCKLNQEAQIDMSISKKRKSQAKKITGFQFAPGNPSEILVTSADSQIRVFNGITVLQKFKGFKNTSSQLSATYSGDGRYVVCASEDSHVYVWRRAGGGICGGAGGGGGIGVKAKTWLTSRSYEYFFCRDVSAAVPWPCSPSTSTATASARAPDVERHSASVHGGSRRSDDDAPGGGAPLPMRPKSGPMTFMDGQAQMLRKGASSSSSRDCAGNAWGMVVVTASLGGEIRVYQNFGMPLGIRGQSARFH